MLLRIDNLANRLEDLDLIKQWTTKGQTTDEIIGYLKHLSLDEKNKFFLPMVLVALLDEEPVGTITLSRKNNLVQSEDTPWISNFFVVEEERNKGIGTYMYNYMLEEALTMEINILYTASNPSILLDKLGWVYKETAMTAYAEEINIYQIEID
ncbi:GNAT family N-acetyltransferase [Candidatus Pristimantibacillus sp. PTI5]|uniref:GNAT family N-acetyltransferase n=1 Tax=Candidatus Pristimantibacillus sp. PTI5 TaxID=3400422 RepID=UPI003B010CE8